MITKETKDLYLFAAYLACGAEFINADRTDPKNIVFKVEMKTNNKDKENSFVAGLIEAANRKHLDEIEAAWVNKTLDVNACAYADAIRRAKALVHSR